MGYDVLMRTFIVLLIGFLVGALGGYFVGYDHGFEGAVVQLSPTETPGDEAGDAAETMRNLIGVWQGVQDTKFTRTFRNDGSVIDDYEGSSPDSEGLWMVFTKEIPDGSYIDTLQPGAVYLSMAMSESERLYFQVTRIDATTLELVFLKGGGVLSFQRIQ